MANLAQIELAPEVIEREPTWIGEQYIVLTVAEMNLLKAEALIRLNRVPEAVAIINTSRTAPVGVGPNLPEIVANASLDLVMQLIRVASLPLMGPLRKRALAKAERWMTSRFSFASCASKIRPSSRISSATSALALVISGKWSLRRPLKRDWIAMCGKCSAVSEVPSHCTAARNSTPASWRTLPGQP